MRPTKERLEEIRSLAFVTNYNSQTGSSPSMIEDLLTEIDALTTELKASEWVRRDNSLRTYDGLTERLAALEKERDEWVAHSTSNRSQLNQVRDEFDRCFNAMIKAEKERDRLRDILKDIMSLFDDGTLCRDIRNDDKPNWALRMMKLVTTLKSAQELVGSHVQAASNCQHVYGDKGLTCFKCGQDVSHLKETHE